MVDGRDTFFIELRIKDVLTSTDDAVCSEINKHLVLFPAGSGFDSFVAE